MKLYRTPGVYFERSDARGQAIGPLRTDVAGFVGVAQKGPVHEAVKLESIAQFYSTFGGHIAQAFLAYVVKGFFQNGGTTCWVVRAADPQAVRPAALEIWGGDLTGTLRVIAVSPGAWGNDIRVRLVLRGDTIVSITISHTDGTEQLVRNPGELEPDADGRLQTTTLLSPLVTLYRADSFASGMERLHVRDVEGFLAGGADGIAGIRLEHLTGNPVSEDTPLGLDLLDAIDDVSIVAIPDLHPKPRILPRTEKPRPRCTVHEDPPPVRTVPQVPPEFPPAFDNSQVAIAQQIVVERCERLHDRFALLEPPLRSLPDAVSLWRTSFDSAFGGLYYPWIRVEDPLRLTGMTRLIPPSGHIAGVYARTDRRRGVHKPPANEVLEAASDTEFPVDEIVHGELNDRSVNVIRAYRGRGIRVAGARTLSSDPLWRYINVRRLLSMIEEAIDENTQFTVFEPNDHNLRSDIERVIRAYLETLFRAGMLDGGNSEEAYTVRCDDALNPQTEQDLGRVISEVGVQPPLPAEFVIARIGRTLNGIEVLEETGGVNA